jgi:predicted NAD/FAD-binding protein
MKKVAVIGSGISGTSSAYYLNKLGYDVTVFEAGSYFGGHTNTIDIEIDNQKIPVDTGFLVHNDRTYPNLIDFFEELKIETYPSDMSFSVVRKSDNLIWSGTNLATVFAQVKNIFSLRFWRFLKEVLRFNNNAQTYLEESTGDIHLTLGDLLKRHNYSEDFQHWYLLPMGGCIWSTPTNEMLAFPAYTFLRFSMNHGLLQIFNRPQWKTLVGGCKTYVHKALANIDKKFLNEPVVSLHSEDSKIRVKTKTKDELFDYCVVTTHPPQILEMDTNIDATTKITLNNFKYSKNTAVLHLDEEILPEKKLAWAAWNYMSAKQDDGNESVSVSYLINMLQPLPTEKQVIVSLNPVTKIDQSKIIKTIEYEHPLFNTAAINSQVKIEELQGRQGIYFAGAWLRYGFHEDGILSAKKALTKLLADDKSSKELKIL